MREAFPSLPSGTPDLEKRTDSKNNTNIENISKETIGGSGGGGSGGSSSSYSNTATTTSGSLKKFELQTTPQLNKGRKTTTTKVGHQQSYNTKFSSNTIIKSDGQAHLDRDNTCLCKPTSSSEYSDGMYKLI